MFLYLYYLCVSIFLLQGALWPVLLIASGVLWWKQSRRLERVKGELGREPQSKVKAKHKMLAEAALDNLPKLKPLKCANCGGASLLEETGARCPYCDASQALPADYAAAARLKTEIRSLLRSALRHWRVANAITWPPLGWLFFLMIFIEPLVILPVTIIGSNVFPNTWADRLLGALGETMTFPLMLSAFLGCIVWMIVFICLSQLGKTLRRQLPVVPVFSESLRGNETAECQSCGGGIEYERGAFACLCSYCNVGNFRVQFAGRERAQAEGRKTTATFALFGAMSLIEDFVGTFFFVFLLLCVASLLLVVVQGLSN
jgi:Zn finger protein HypA/HybF involved in hydrogenase expression